MNYNNKIFKPIANSKNAEVSEETVFKYKQKGNILTSNYKGGQILKGHLIGIVNDDGTINLHYHQINKKGEFMTGICFSKPQVMEDGKLLLHETWEWTSGDRSKGHSILKEI